MKMSIIKTMKNIALGAVLYAAASLSGGCAKPEPVHLGYNAVEVAAESDGGSRVRALNNVDVDIGSLAVGYHGLNEVSDLESETYFGNHNFTVGGKDSATKGVVTILTGSDGVIDTKVGIRNTSLIDVLGSYGSIDLLANAEGANVTALIGKPFGDGWSIEVYQSTNIPFDGKPSHYTELQLNKALEEHVNVFTRVETNYSEDKVVAGIAGTF